MPVHITPLTDPSPSASSRRLVLLATDTSGHPVGSACLRLFTAAGQRHLVELDLHVHPADRRLGIGTRLLKAAVQRAKEEHRRSVIVQADAGSPGDAFLSARGFRRVLSLTFARLPLPDADAHALAETPRPGYRLLSWLGSVPDELAESFAASRSAMDDMPMDGTDYGTVVWDTDRVRSAAKVIEERGDLLRTVVAVDESDGTIAGFTELVVPGDGHGDAQHYGTGVLPRHRGNGLGRWMKAESIRQAQQAHPGLGGLLTDTAESNAPMLRINDALGYAPTHRAFEYQLDL
ncbi:GNAT family N-acetyltransferase [Streptomyces albipurpureus]|uniref:GNAT family N-acetyltransferase n=1 Tax=Streptomyces albipurpureus TaxID=2897419 RepID=A0ABT0UY09_9ACTN|nr:GNAT family N-acetyltransferase [Streptomyces sp. CWNU-1]MCM2393462.1 GNAT family N-acetyltransferase [Streptomyces sp. CWNU-1]